MTKLEYIEVEIVKLRGLYRWAMSSGKRDEGSQYRYQIMFLENELKKGRENEGFSSENFRKITL